MWEPGALDDPLLLPLPRARLAARERPAVGVEAAASPEPEGAVGDVAGEVALAGAAGEVALVDAEYGRCHF